jgi:5-methylcytosine-specific restriction endonuclease McrA
MCPSSGNGLKPTTDFLYWSERDEIRKAIFARDLPFCVWCQEEVGDHRSNSYYSADHIIPRSLGGGYHPDNLVLSCKPCNSERGNLSILQYMALRAQRLSAIELAEGYGRH